MKLLATSDWHLDAVTAGLERCLEVKAYASELVQVVEREEVDLVLHLGDLLDPGHLRDSAYQRVLFQLAAQLNSAARYGSIWLPGNHDVLDEAEPTSTLSPLAAASAAWASHDPNPLQVVELPKFVMRKLPEGRANFLCLPYVSRATMNTAVYQEAFQEALRQAEGRSNLVVLSHLSLPGMHPGSEEEMPRGREVAFPLQEVKKLNPALVLQGHYHKRQTVKVSGLVVEVVGAPVRFTFGERADGPRGYLLVEL